MFELIFEGRVQARGSKQAMQNDRKAMADFTGRDISQYKIVQVA
jgi:hypothetical protein